MATSEVRCSESYMAGADSKQLNHQKRQKAALRWWLFAKCLRHRQLMHGTARVSPDQNAGSRMV